MNRLAEKLSDVLENACRDLKLCIDDPDTYEIDMGVYHWSGSYSCHVCLAGSVMAQTLEGNPNEDLNPEDMESYDSHTRDRLIALDLLRCGEVTEALEQIDVKRKWRDLNRSVAEYKEDPKQFFTDMAEIVRDLREAGL